MTLSVHMLYPSYGEGTLSQMRARLHPSIRLTVGPGLPVPADYHILISGHPEPDQITASANLHALMVPWAGIPESTRETMLQFPHISVHNLHHNALPVAEHAIALLLAASKWITPMDRSLRAHDWTPRYQRLPSLLLEGRTALVLGYGAIGQKVCALCRALGMKVTAIRHHVETAPASAPDGTAIAAPDALHDLLAQAHVLIVCLPHTPATTGLVGAKELALLPSESVLVNVGRGPIVDEAALYNALREGTLYAAGLDVWYNYPADEITRSCTPPSNFPFHELDNVVMSPHRAGTSTGTESLRIAHLVEALNAAAEGRPIPNRVDLHSGY